MKKPLVIMLLLLVASCFFGACSNEATDSPDGTGIGCTMPEEKDPLGWYGFRAFKDGERYCVVVSAARGQIEVQEKQGE